jgi:hypothetical protein
VLTQAGLALLVRLTIGHPPIGRLTWIRLLLAIRLLGRIRRQRLIALVQPERLLMPLARIWLAIRTPRRLLAHDSLPGAARCRALPVRGTHAKLLRAP